MINDYKDKIFDAIVFVWGLWSLDFIQNETVKNLTKTHINAWKVLASICAAPRNFLAWGIAKDKKITWADWDNNFEKLAKNAWAIPEQKPVVIDWNLITWNWPEVVEEFALAIIDKLK
jgi:putative intracellular protease/amidase